MSEKKMINRQFKDRMFRLLMSKKETVLEVHNALFGTKNTDACDVEMSTVEGAIYIGTQNDLSFFLRSYINIWEHQSTWNPNMPIRFLPYAAQVLQKYVKSHGMNLYSTAIKKLPWPQFVVFYNGTGDAPDRQVLKLSDAYAIPKDPADEKKQTEVPALEIRVLVLNINLGRNETLMEACPTLKQYAQFVAQVRDNRKAGWNMEEAVTKAVDDCIREGILRDFLISMKAEEISMFIEEFSDEEIREMELEACREYGLEQGRAEGREKGREEGLAQGKAEGYERVNRLIQELASAGRASDIVRSAADPVYQEQLFAEFCL